MKKLMNAELNRLTVEEFKTTRKYPVVVVLDNVRSLNNIGSIFRTSDAFLVEGIYLCGITATPPHREINKTALGATESVYWQYFGHTTEAVQSLKNRKYNIIAVEQTDSSTPLCQLNIRNDMKYALVFGHEVRGVEQKVADLCDESIEIPQLGTKHSINIAVSAGIVLWEFFRFFQLQQS
ncbi:MAG: RNA methyltransferase [Bacteroidales bacterium]|nr:RNA methyltransferase [Bacteroidales bacterium]